MVKQQILMAQVAAMKKQQSQGVNRPNPAINTQQLLAQQAKAKSEMATPRQNQQQLAKVIAQQQQLMQLKLAPKVEAKPQTAAPS